ncbi:hypothetical protein [Microbacterium sp. RURRCA19A]|uniref:hypothetical protein n=1 Tax=Microbacterium sp. RURRCA19A TaxID=1907391 RepID=UPI000956062F|nr:hypothetical protein [Microbacterium sp. RURRCA19A]SIS19764.1 hypothetical protein SAMN05880568_3481 [Microbacterium sp. RURRCA19A]
MNEDETWTDRDDAAVVAEGMPPQSPVRCADAFMQTLLVEGDDADRALESLVTPESLHLWAGFGDARRWAAAVSVRLSTTAWYGRGAPDVAYVKLVPEDGRPWVVAEARDDDALAWISLVWRPEITERGPLASWRVHSIGLPIDPEELPRTAIGVDPRQLS